MSSDSDVSQWFNQYTTCALSGVGVVSDASLALCLELPPAMVVKLQLRWWPNVCAGQACMMCYLLPLHPGDFMVCAGGVFGPALEDSMYREFAITMQAVSQQLKKMEDSTDPATIHTVDLKPLFTQYLEAVQQKAGPIMCPDTCNYVSMELIMQCTLQLASGRTSSTGVCDKDTAACKQLMLHQLQCGSGLCDAYLHVLRDILAVMFVASQHPSMRSHINMEDIAGTFQAASARMMGTEMEDDPSLSGFWGNLFGLTDRKEADEILLTQQELLDDTITFRGNILRLCNLAASLAESMGKESSVHASKEEGEDATIEEEPRPTGKEGEVT